MHTPPPPFIGFAASAAAPPATHTAAPGDNACHLLDEASGVVMAYDRNVYTSTLLRQARAQVVTRT